MLREHLKAVLPDYMVPAALVLLEALPLTPNGKLDRRALPAPDLSACTTREFIPPQGEVEETLATLWCELLGAQRVGRQDNFFELGGHSLHGIRLTAQLAERLGARLPVMAVFRHPTIERMAAAIDAVRAGTTTSADVEAEQGVI
jgi:hypothetical protein